MNSTCYDPIAEYTTHIGSKIEIIHNVTVLEAFSPDHQFS